MRGARDALAAWGCGMSWGGGGGGGGAKTGSAIEGVAGGGCGGSKVTRRPIDHPAIQFTFLGYTFRPRKAVDKYGRVYVNFSPAVSRDALKAMRQTIRRWHLQLKSDKSLADLSAMFAPILKGWQQYYGHYHGSALKPVWRNMNLFLIRWLMRKHKRLAGHKTRAAEMLRQMAQRQPGEFVHWSLGYQS